MKNIIVRFNGGLGNQMSQYAMMVFLRYMYPHRQIIGDISRFSEYVIHNDFELNKIFNISFKTQSKFFKFMESKLRYKRENIVQQYVSGYPEDKRIYNLEDNIAYSLDGTWCNYDYSSIRKLLLKEFVFPEVTDDKNKKWLDKISNSNSVSIHVRKGDYVDYGLDIVDKDYYTTAIEIIKEKVDSPVFFVFSDENVESLFSNVNEKFYFIEGNKGNMAYVDMQLMKWCKHNIITNSTFSYWAAILNENENKIVIRPKMQTKTNKTWNVDGWILL